MYLFQDVDRDQPDKKSIMMYLTTLFDTLPHKEIVLEDSSELSSTSTETVQSSRVIKVTQNTYEVLYITLLNLQEFRHTVAELFSRNKLSLIEVFLM